MFFFWISQELRFFSKEIEGPYWTSLKMVIDGWEIPPKSTLPCAILDKNKNPRKNHKRFVTKLEGWWTVSLTKGFKFFLLQTCVLHLDLFPTLPPQLVKDVVSYSALLGACQKRWREAGGWLLRVLNVRIFHPKWRGITKFHSFGAGKHQRFGNFWVTEGFSGKVYPSSHSHGSGKWVPAILVSFDLG